MKFKKYSWFLTKFIIAIEFHLFLTDRYVKVILLNIRKPIANTPFKSIFIELTHTYCFRVLIYNWVAIF